MLYFDHVIGWSFTFSHGVLLKLSGTPPPPERVRVRVKVQGFFPSTFAEIVFIEDAHGLQNQTRISVPPFDELHALPFCHE